MAPVMEGSGRVTEYNEKFNRFRFEYYPNQK